MAEMEANHQADDLTAERAAAERVIRECPEVWNRVCYLSDCTFQALATRILEYGQQTRQEALREAARAICPYCNDPNWPSVNQYGDHASPHTSSLFMCKAWKIHQLDRLASEGG